MAVEIDGGQHNQPLGIKRDRRRTEFLEQQGIRVLRFWNHEVLSETEAVLQVIYDAIVGSVPHAEPHHCPHPNPLPEGEGIVSEEEFRWPQHILDLFPDRLVDSELGEIPEGWEVKRLGDVLELAYGKALKDADRQPGAVPVYGSNGQVGWHKERLVEGPGIIMGRKGNPGTVNWAATDFFAIDTTFYVRPKGECRSLSFLFYALRMQDLPSLAVDSAVPGLNRNFVYANLQLIPNPVDGIAKFCYHEPTSVLLRQGEAGCIGRCRQLPKMPRS